MGMRFIKTNEDKIKRNMIRNETFHSEKNVKDISDRKTS